MFEKVNPSHPDKVADRIAGALVDLAYKNQESPKVAVEVLIGHKVCTVIAESSYNFSLEDVKSIVDRIAGTGLTIHLVDVPQDIHLANNQKGELRCGDNGIFKGEPMTPEEIQLSYISDKIYQRCGKDGKYILDEKNRRLIICQSWCFSSDFKKWFLSEFPEYSDYDIIVNPLGDWTGGIDVDSGATNRKLGSDMGRSVTGGGLHGKDLSKADVSVNIYAWLKAQETGKTREFCCAIGDTEIDGRPYSEIVDVALGYIRSVGGFEAFAETGLV